MLAPEEQEEELFEEYKDGDDSAVTVKALVKHITTLVSPAATSSTHWHLKEDDDGFLMSSGIAESLELEVEDKEITAKKMTLVGRHQVKKPTPVWRIV